MENVNLKPGFIRAAFRACMLGIRERSEQIAMTKSSAQKWKVPFLVRKLDSKWCVLERFETGLGLVSYWDTRSEAREAVRQLNQEERRGR